MTRNYFWNHLTSSFCERSNSKTSVQLCMLILLWHSMHPIVSARRSTLQRQTLQKGHPCHSAVFQFRFDPVLGNNYTIKYLGVYNGKQNNTSDLRNQCTCIRTSTYFMKVAIAAWMELVRAERWCWFSEWGPLQTDLWLSGKRIPHKSKSMGFSSSRFLHTLDFLCFSCNSCDKIKL